MSSNLRRYFLSTCLIVAVFALPLWWSTGAAHQKATAQEPTATAARISVLVELESEPLSVYKKRLESATQPGQFVDFASAENQTRLQTYEAQLMAEHQSFSARAFAVAPALKVNTELRMLLNAVSIEVEQSELAAITRLAGVRRARLTKTYRATLNQSVGNLNTSALWQQLGGASVAGEGIKIAVLDTGIDISNPLFSDAGFSAPQGFPRGSSGFTNNKVIVAKVFLAGFGNTPGDEFGHGSHVAGIAAGNANTLTPLARLSGVAPRAYLGNYRVLDRVGEGRDDFIIRALEEAVRDGFDVINLSFGGDASTELGALDVAVENAVAAGTVVVTSAGNNGDDGLMMIASPGIAPSAITVGATTNGHLVGSGATVSVSGAAPSSLTEIAATRGESNGVAFPLDSGIGSLPLIDIESVDGNRRGCVDVPARSLSGGIALIERGSCSFFDKVNNAAIAGAQAAIIFNDDVREIFDSGDTLLFMDVTGARIPSVFIKRSDGLALREWLKTHPDAQVQIFATSLTEIRFPADVLAEFSSRGPSVLRNLKPDLTAPGDSIYSAAINGNNFIGISDASGFRAASGTSQAAPHVAGAAALVKQLHPSWAPAQIKSALMNSATNLISTNLDTVMKADVLDAGAGRLDLSRAAVVSATFSPASLSFGFVKLRQLDATAVIQLTVANVTNRPKEYRIRVEETEHHDGFRVTAKPKTISLQSGETTTINVRLAAVAGVAQWRDYTGYVVVSEPATPSLRVPYWVRLIRK
jgi:minor extracellular serine protease Vpr